MIKSVTVTNFRGDTLKLELSKPEESGLLILSIDGIGPGDASINLTDLSSTDGSIYNSSRIPNRIIDINIAPLFVNTIEESRLRAYKYFPLGRHVELVFETDSRTCKIDGYVATNKPDIFKEMETIAISINCPYPFFKDMASSSMKISGVEPLFEFVYENLYSYSDQSRNTEFGMIHSRDTNYIDYIGDHDAGMEITISVLGALDGFINLYNTTLKNDSKVFHINVAEVETVVGRSLNIGDTISVITKTNEKTAYVTYDGITKPIINCCVGDWFQLIPGRNVFEFSVTGEDSDSSDNITVGINYDILYEGV